MANYDEPVSSSLEAAEAMKALAHATLKFGDQPEDTFSVLGDMLAITSSYVRVLGNVADAHERKIDDAHDDQEQDVTAGRVLARAAARSLRLAAFQVADAYRHVDDATAMSGRIVWFPDPRASTDPDRVRAPSHRSTAPRTREREAGASSSGPAPSPADHTDTSPEAWSL